MQAISFPTECITSGYVLLESANLDPRSPWQELPMQLCEIGRIKDADDLTPRLIDMSALSPTQQKWVSTGLRFAPLEDEAPILCAWLETDADLEQLKRAITRFLIGPGPEGRAVYWRYYDPRVFALTMHLFSAEQRSALLGPVTQWRFPWCGHWWSVAGPGAEIDVLGGSRPAWPTASQWSSLAHCDVLDMVLRRLTDNLADRTPSEILLYQRRAEAALMRGRQVLKLNDPGELMEYALLCLRYGSAFLDHPPLYDAWPALARGKINWSTLLQRLGPDDYRQMEAVRHLMAPSTGAAQ
ncbi:DUF4123 domain-containing protein [Herbaspirillum rubrisubalbicans]|uniref:DUF4123 domain-containing protein n=1 Tax=Herbaspirillum rubrisubalbicans TaxID=80842 RepID=UPI001559CE0D|nr:DUF4123 domain-containing protein [Herbaspirillum rubrisubalbicans]NQE48139.1 hypothetical protein [Herbaspirillum rubrisubalbicans]